MLSPDVPEFIPRSYQTSALPRREEDSSGEGGWRHQQKEPHTAWDASPTHSAPAQHASNIHTMFKKDASKYSPDKTKTEGRERSKLTQYRPAPPPKKDVSASNNRNSDASNWTVKEGVHDAFRDISSKDHLPSQKSIVNRTGHSSESEKYQQDKDNPMRGKGKAKKYNYATSETYLMSNTSVQQRSNHEDGVSYKKILQRNRNDGITWEPQPSSSPVTSLPLDEQWPMLGDSRTQTGLAGNKKNPEVKKQQGAWLGSSIDTPVRESLDNRNNMRVPTSTWIAQSSSYARDGRHSYKDKGGVGDEAKSSSYNERARVESCEDIIGTNFKIGKTGLDQISVNTHKPRQITSKYKSNKEYTVHSNKFAKSGKSSGKDCVTSQKNIDTSKSFPVLGKGDAIEWQVRREKKIQSKTKELHKTGQSPQCKMDILGGDSGRREPALASGGDKVVRGVIVLGSNKDTKNTSWSRGTKYNRRQENRENRSYSGEFREHLQGSWISDNKQASDSVGLDAEKSHSDEKMIKNTDKVHSGEGKPQKPVNPGIAQRNLEFSDEPVTKLGESGPFEWQVKGFKKKQAKTKEVPSEKNWSPRLERKMPDKDSGDRSRVPASARKRTTPGVVILRNKQDTSKASRPRNDRLNENQEKDTMDCASVSQETRNNALWGSDKNQTRPTLSSQIEKRSEGESRAENRKLIEESPTDAKPQQPLDPKAARKKLEAKQRKKEEKIRNREEKIKQAQRNLSKDSKVTVVTREFLEKSSKTSVDKPAFISEHQLRSCEEYPTLLTARNRVTGAAPKKNVHSSILAHRTNAAACSARHYDINEDSDPYESEQSSVSYEESSDESDTSTPASTISYSGALQAAKKAHKTSPQARNIANPEIYVTPQKKKVKTKDLIEFDLMAYALQSKRNKMKAVGDPKEKTQRALKGRKTGPITTVAAARLPKVKGVTVVKRGKQREKKKGVTNLKKAFMKMKEKKLEALNLLLQGARTAIEKQEALKCEATSTPTDPLLPTITENEGEENEEENSKITTDKIVIQGEENIEEIQEEKEDKGREAEENTQSLVHLMEQVVSENRENKAEECDDKKNSDSVGKCSENEPIIKELSQPDNPGLDYEKARFLITEEIKILQDPFQTSDFREYCDHVITDEVNETVTQLVKSLVRFQQQHFARDPTKATIRRRYVCGLKQTTKLMGKMTCLIIAPNIQYCPEPGGLNEAVEKTLHQARVHSVPVVFALSIKRLGSLCYKHHSVSCFGIISYQGAQDTFHELMNLVASARVQYRTMINSGRKSSSLTHGHQNKAPEHESSPDLGLHLTAREKSPKPTPDYHTLLLSALLSTPSLSSRADSPDQTPRLTTQEFSEE